MTRVYLVVATVLALAVACGDDNGDGDGTNDDAAVEIDAADNDGTIDTDAATSDGTTSDTPGNNTDAAVGTMCGTMTCTTAQECCVQGQGRTCVAEGTCGGVNFDCDGAEDCDTGQLCCYAAGGGGGGTTCDTAANCPAPTCATMTDCPMQDQECCTIGEIQVCLAQCPGP